MNTITLTYFDLALLIVGAILGTALLARSEGQRRIIRFVTPEKAPRLHWHTLKSRARPSAQAQTLNQQVTRIRVARVIEATRKKRQRDNRPRPSLRA